jgi:RNA polymerase sigma factor (TIGR02999 family)
MSARPEDPAQERARTVARLVETADVGASELAHELLPVLYEELRALARARLAREAPGRTLQATALVHEAYLRLVGNQDPGWNGRAHFFGAAAQAMRRILVEEARRKKRTKRGGGRERVDLADVEIPVEPPVSDVLAVDEAVKKLEESDPRKAAIVSLRYFAGLTAEETARALEVSLGTVEREWRFIKVWLQEELEG